MEMLTQRWEKVGFSLHEVVTVKTSPCSLWKHRTSENLYKNGQISMQTHAPLCTLQLLPVAPQMERNWGGLEVDSQ